MAYSMVDAAYRLLQENGTPQHYRQLVREALKRGWIITKGLTPEASLVAAISRENAKRKASGETPRFDVSGSGMYGLAEWKRDIQQNAVEKLNHSTRVALRGRISQLLPKQFEKLVERVLLTLEFDPDTVRVKGQPGDRGIDVVGEMEHDLMRVTVAIQVKKVGNKIGSKEIRNLRGSLEPHQRGIFITTSDFTKSAIEEARAPGKTPISLMNGEELLRLMFTHQIGVAQSKDPVFVLNNEFWNELSNGATLASSLQEVQAQQNTLEYPIAIFVEHKGKRINATLSESHQVTVNDKTYKSVSAAAMAVTGWKSCNGWRFWSFVDPADNCEYPLDVLRKSNA